MDATITITIHTGSESKEIRLKGKMEGQFQFTEAGMEGKIRSAKEGGNDACICCPTCGRAFESDILLETINERGSTIEESATKEVDVLIADETTKASDVDKEEEVYVINEEDLPECSESYSTSDDEPKPYNPVFASNMNIASTCKRIHYAECKGRPRRIRTKVRSNPPPKPISEPAPSPNTFDTSETSTSAHPNSDSDHDIEPDIKAIATLASIAIPGLGKNPDIQFYRKGRHNKVYSISSAASNPEDFKYLFRVCKPYDSYLKISSEVATMTYLRQETTIPIPEIIAYDPLPENYLGYAWVIIEFVQGQTMTEVWRGFTVKEREDICHQMKGYMTQIVNLPSVPAIGSLYFSSDLMDKSHPETFVIGPEVDVTKGHNPILSRGPHASILDYILSEHINLFAFLNDIDSYYEFDTPRKWNPTGLEEQCNAVARKICSDTPCSHFVFSHPDLVDCNILVGFTPSTNPHSKPTPTILAILDWEGTISLPASFVCKVFSFLDYYGGTTLLQFRPPVRDFMSQDHYFTETIMRAEERMKDVRKLYDGNGRMPKVCSCEEECGGVLRGYMYYLKDIRRGMGWRASYFLKRYWETGAIGEAE